MAPGSRDQKSVQTLVIHVRSPSGSQRRGARIAARCRDGSHDDSRAHDNRHNHHTETRARSREHALMIRLVPRGKDARLWRPPAHWRLLGFCLLVVVALILFEGFATHTIGVSAEPHDPFGGPAPLAHSRPILTARGHRLVSTEPAPGRRIALTFDDGPDLRWTPRIAAILRREHVPATFFVIGSQAARNPGIVRLLVRNG